MLFSIRRPELDRQKRERHFEKSINWLGPNRQNYTARFLLFGGTQMSRNTRRSQRRAASIVRSNRKSWFRRYLKALSTGVAAASIGTLGLLAQPAHGANHIWIGNTSNLWNVPANWSAIPVANETN